jgi:hypothetical protein
MPILYPKKTNIRLNVELKILQLDIICKQTRVENGCSMLGCLTTIHINVKFEFQSLKLQSFEVTMKLK